MHFCYRFLLDLLCIIMLCTANNCLTKDNIHNVEMNNKGILSLSLTELVRWPNALQKAQNPQSVVIHTGVFVTASEQLTTKMTRR